MRGTTWIGAASASLVAHAAFATMIDRHEVHAAAKRPPVIVQLSAPKPMPHIATPPPPPPPPPPPKPVLVKKLALKPVAPIAPPPPAAPKIGVDVDATAPDSAIAVPTGVSEAGEPGTGNSMDPTPAPPAPPEPPAPKPAPTQRQHFVPIYRVTQMPKARHAVAPEIPDAFRQADREALVVVEVELDVGGHVTAATVVRHAEFGLDDAALAAARQTEFEPALVGTQPVPVRYQIPYRFRVRG